MLLLAFLLAAQSDTATPVADPRIAMVENAVRAELKDPDSAKFTWPYGFVSGWYKRPLHAKAEGEITCGTVNAKNGYGGYTGAIVVIAVVRDGAVIETDIDENPYFGDNKGLPSEVCRELGMTF